MESFCYLNIRAVKIYQKNEKGNILFYPRFCKGSSTFKKVLLAISTKKLTMYTLRLNVKICESSINTNIDNDYISHDNNDTDFDESYDIQSETDYPIKLYDKQYYIMYVLIDGFSDYHKFYIQ